MTWFDYFLVAFWLFGIGMTVTAVGKPRRPIESTTAAIVVMINLLFIAGLLFTRGVFA